MEEGPFTPKIHGPYLPEYKVTIADYEVPHITARPCEDGRIDVIVDHRFGMEPVSRDEFNRWMPLLANAMAVAAGYTSHGENCNPLKDTMFKRKIIGLGSIDPKPNLTLVRNEE